MYSLLHQLFESSSSQSWRLWLISPFICQCVCVCSSLLVYISITMHWILMKLVEMLEVKVRFIALTFHKIRFSNFYFPFIFLCLLSVYWSQLLEVLSTLEVRFSLKSRSRSLSAIDSTSNNVKMWIYNVSTGTMMRLNWDLGLMPILWLKRQRFHLDLFDCQRFSRTLSNFFECCVLPE